MISPPARTTVLPPVRGPASRYRLGSITAEEETFLHAAESRCDRDHSRDVTAVTPATIECKPKRAARPDDWRVSGCDGVRGAGRVENGDRISPRRDHYSVRDPQAAVACPARICRSDFDL